MQERIRLAIQKKGRLHEDTMDLLRKADFSISSSNRYLLKVNNFPMDIILVRDDDVPYVVASNSCHWGIVGKDVFEEVALSDEEVKATAAKTFDFDFGVCRLSIAVPGNMPYQSIADLHDKRIATSYPELLKRFLKERKIHAHIIPMHGSVEVAPKIKIADAICDLVSSGATLQENNLVEKEEIFTSNAALICNRKNAEYSEETYREFITRIESVQKAEKRKYVMMNAPKNQLEKVISMLPKSTSPTIAPLKDPEMVGVHVLLENDILWETLHRLKESGASSILVLPVQKMIL